ncbi:MAG: hypothetical protein PHD21_08015 [Flavobacteriales bacterium]|nr:hypothetical protein [Flavobacteriales bacterium]
MYQIKKSNISKYNRYKILYNTKYAYCEIKEHLPFDKVKVAIYLSALSNGCITSFTQPILTDIVSTKDLTYIDLYKDSIPTTTIILQRHVPKDVLKLYIKAIESCSYMCFDKNKETGEFYFNKSKSKRMSRKFKAKQLTLK